jgi:hypothetical protein
VRIRTEIRSMLDKIIKSKKARNLSIVFFTLSCFFFIVHFAHAGDFISAAVSTIFNAIAGVFFNFAKPFLYILQL